MSWAFNFIVRAILVKGLVVGIAGSITLEIFTLVNYLWPLYIGFIVILFDEQRRGWHDQISRTFVVRT